ncbi:MAG: UbiA prenyltransferase family protein [Thermoplasmatales archaeon]|nr:MAG: UbiA prenyltransferase family protein [Thermoplasmatales archaeon]
MQKVKNYLKLGRSFGTTNTWGAIFIGVLTSTVMVSLLDAFKILAISFFAHAYIGAINEYWHIEEDKKHPQYKYKPLVRGDVSKKNAKIYIYFCLIFAIILSFVFYNNYLKITIFGSAIEIPATVFLILAAAFGTLYTVKGKYISWAYDLTPSFGAGFLIIYGATTIGDITSTTIVAAFCAFMISVYSEWIDGMKDVDTDKKFKVPTTAVRWGYSHSKKLTFRDPNYLYFILIVISIDIAYSMPFLTKYVFSMSLFPELLTPTYFYIFIFVGVPIQCYLIYKLYGKQNKESLRKHPLLFIGTTMVLAFILVIDKIAIWGVIIILIFVLGWVYVFSLFGIQFSKDKLLFPIKKM